MTDKAAAIQAKIDAKHEEFRKQRHAIDAEAAEKLNAAYAKRAAVLEQKAPKAFWAMVIRSHSDLSQEMLGPYDDEILESLEAFDVRYTATGFRLTMRFGPNDYFVEKELWAEDDDGDLSFSGITWKEGKGPAPEAEEGDEEEEEGEEDKNKRLRDDHGPSLFEVFEKMGPHPEEDDQLLEEVEEEEDLDEIIAEYEEEEHDRHDVLQCLVEEVWEKPVDCLVGAVEEGSKEEEKKKE